MAKSEYKYRISNRYMFVLFILCALPRIGLWMVNTEGNDDHVTPIQMWQEKGKFPEARDCWECFQPPLFYSIVKPWCSFLDANETEDVFKVIQSINLVLNLLILWLIIWYINTLKLERLLSIALILFWGLNPELVSIGALASNDTLTILLGMVFTILVFRYIKSSTLYKEMGVAILIFLLGITKGNGLIFLGLFPILIGIKLILTKKLVWKQIARQFLVWSLTLLAIAYAGNYIDKYQKYNNPFITNVDPPYEKATWNTPGDMIFRKGVDTYKEAFFSFPIVNLIQEPYNENGLENYPKHRQNLWTQFLGQFSNHLFERYPLTWVSHKNDMYNFSRVNFVLHIILLLLLITGIIWAYGHKTTIDIKLLGHSVIALIFLTFVIRYSAQYRDFSFMKVVFIYPAYISLIYLSSIGIQKWNYPRFFAYLCIACSILYEINYFYLIEALRT